MPVTFPATKLTVIVKLLGVLTPGVWTDVSQYVYKADKVRIKRGLSPNDQSHDGTFDWCEVVFKNQDRRFSPRNMNGPYFGRLTVNTRMQVFWNAGNGDIFRFEGQIPVWPPTFGTGERRTVKVQATDDRRKMTIGPGLQVAHSPIYTSTTMHPSLVSYMPLEDGEDTDTPTLIDGLRVAINGTFDWAGDSSLPGSNPLPVFDATSYIIVSPAVHTYNGHWQADWFDKIDAAPSGTTILKRIWVNNTGASGIAFWDITLTSTTYQVNGYDRNGTSIVFSGAFDINALQPGQWMHMRLMAQNASATTFDYQFVTFRYDVTGGAVLSGSGITGQCGNIGAMSIGMAQAGYAGFSTGQVAFYDAYNLSTVDSSGNGYNGEAPGTRWTRILDEQGIASNRRVGSSSDTVAMGRQTSKSVIDLLRECLIANEGFMDGSSTTTDDGELRFTERMYIEERATAAADMVVDYSARRAWDLITDDGDGMIVNDRLGTRAGGGSARIEKTTGARNVHDPAADPLGVGRYPDTQTYSLSTDAQVADHAGWGVNLGTVDEPRVVNLELWFERPGMASLLTTWESLDTWRRVQVTNPPTDLGAETLDFMIAGYEEEFDQHGIHVRINGRASSPYRVGILDSSGGATSDQRLDSDDTRTWAAVTAGATTLPVYNTGSDEALATVWAHDDGDYGVEAGGEVMTVTAVATATRSFVGAGTAQTTNNAATTALAIHASTAVGDLMVLVGGSRNVNVDLGFTPPDSTWVSKVNNLSSLKIWTKRATVAGGGTGPIVTPTGGAAGDDLLAQVYTFRNVTDRQFGDAAAVQVNGSAANIAFPALVANRFGPCFIVAGLRADDWTGGAPPGSLTECGDFSSTVGNDAGLWVGYQFATAGTVESIDAGTITITGGASAVSRAAVIALDCSIQNLTVTRGGNNAGTGIALARDLEVHVTKPIILGV